MANVIGSATIRIMPDSSGFNASLQGQLKGVNSSLQGAFGNNGGGGALKNFNANLSVLSEGIGRASSRMIGMGEAMTYGITRPLIGLAKTVVDTAAQFDQSMKFIQAVSRTDISNPVGAANLKEIRDLALDLGRVGKFSANEMASAFEVIARSGADTDGTAEQLRARIEGLGNTVREVATIEKTDMASATQYMVEVFTGFGGSLRQAGEFAKHLHTDLGDLSNDPQGLAKEFTQMGDILTTVSVNSVNSITELANALRYAGPVASAAGVSFEDTAAALGVLGEAGFKGTVGGTAFRGIITRLTAATKQSTDELDKLGLSAKEAFGPDSTGGLQMTTQEIDDMASGLRRAGVDGKSIDEVMSSIGKNDFAQTTEEMAAKTKNLGVELWDAGGKLKPLAQILPIFQSKLADGTMRIGDVMFLLGQRAGPAFIALLNNTKLFDTMSGAADNAAGATEHVSKVIEEGAVIQLARLKNSFIELAISIGDSGMLGFFVNLAGRLTDFVHTLSASNPEIFKWISIIGALVAAMGPLNIVLGILGKGLNTFLLKPLILLTSPLGLVAVAVGVLVGFFALMVAKSEVLRDALGNLFDSVKLVAGPVLEEMGRMVMGVVGGIAALAGMLGNLLAPVISNVADSINKWVGSGGLQQFLLGAVDSVKTLAYWFYDLWLKVQELGTLQAIGDAFQRIWSDVKTVIEDLQPIFDNLLPAIKEVGGALMVTFGAALRVAWQIAAAFLSVIEKLMGVIKPLADLLGGNLSSVLAIVVARLILTRGAMISTALGFTALGNVVAGTTSVISNGFKRAGDVADAAGSVINASLTKISNVGPFKSGGMLDSLGTKMNNLGAIAETGGTRMALALDKMGKAIGKVGDITKGVFSNAQIIMTGFMSGQMAAHADTLGQAFMNLVPAIMAIGTAMIVIGGPIGIVTALITTLATVLGMAFGKAAEQSKAYTIDISNTIDDLADSFGNLHGELNKGDLLGAFTKAFNALDTNAFTSLTQTLHVMGRDVGDLADAFMSGADATNSFVDNLKKDFINGELTGKLKNFRVEVETLGGVTSDLTKHKVGDVLTDPAEIEKLTHDFVDMGLKLKVVGENTKPIAEGLTDMQGITDSLGKAFEEQFGGQAIRDFVKTIGEARAKYEAMAPVQKIVKEEQDHINDKAKDWSARLADVNSALDESKRRLRELVSPQDNAATANIEFFNTIKDNIDKLKLGPDGTLQIELPDPNKAGAKEWLDATRNISNSWSDFMATTAQNIPFGPNQQQEFQNRLDAMRNSYKDYLTSPDGPFKLSDVQAQAFLDKWAAMPTPDLILKILPEDIDSPEFQARMKKLVNDLKLNDFQAKVFAKIAIAAGDSSDPAQTQVLADWVLKGIPPTMTAPEVDLIVNSLSNLPAGFDAASFAKLVGGGVLAPAQVPVYMQIYGDFSKSGLSQAQIDALLAFGVVDLGHLDAYLNIKAQLDSTGLAGQLPEGFLQQLASASGSPDQYNKTLSILTDLSSTNPDQFNKIVELLNAGTIKPIEVPFVIKMQADGLNPFQMDPATLQTLLAMIPHYDTGGIVGANAGIPGDPTGQVAVVHLGEAVIPADVVAKFGEDAIRQLIAGNLPAAMISVSITVDIVIALMGSEAAGAIMLSLQALVQQAMASILTLMVDGFTQGTSTAITLVAQLQSAFAIASINITNYITDVVRALNHIPDVMSGVSGSIAKGFSNPISFIRGSVWPPFAQMLNAASSAFGMGNVIPVFHDGGVVGQDGTRRSVSGVSNDEMIALLQTGEGVMTREMMASMTADQVKEFRSGNPRWFATGGPFGDGKARVSSHADQVGNGIDTYDVGAMKAAYAQDVAPMLARMQAQYMGNVVAKIGAAGVGKIANGAYDWVNGANEGVQEEMGKRTAAIGLPPGFDVKGSVPAGFDIDHWRSFLGANKAPNDWPLITSYLAAAGVPYLVNSSFRPGGASYHASGRAVDLGAPNDANYDSPGLQRINHALAPMLGVLSELIYAGPGGITDKGYDAATMAGHHNHVHAALAKGGIINGLLSGTLGEAGREVVLPMTNPGRALDIAVESGLFSVLNDAARQRGAVSYGQTAPPVGPSPLGAVPAGRPVPTGADGGFLGGGPGNTYNIFGVGLDQVKAEVKHRDKAVMRVRS